MKNLSTIKLGIAGKLKDKKYRHEFFRRRAQGEIASQIRELRVKRNITQAELAREMSTGQSAVARIEDANYSGWSFATLLKVADTLDARLQIVFRPMEDVMREYDKRDSAVAANRSESLRSQSTQHEKALEFVYGIDNTTVDQIKQTMDTMARGTPKRETPISFTQPATVE